MVSKADIEYSQPRAICRTLVYQWGGEMMFGTLTEERIVADMVTSEKTSTMKARVRDLATVHASGQTVAYKSATGYSPLNTVGSTVSVAPENRPAVGFYGYVFDLEQECTSADGPNKLAAKLRAASVLGGLGKSNCPDRRAFSLSLHYRYQFAVKADPNGNEVVDPTGKARKSGHTVGFYGAESPPKKGYRFFDPNIGVWQFKTLAELISLFVNEWLPEFLANTLNRDPGDSVLEGQRQLTYFRLIEFQKA